MGGAALFRSYWVIPRVGKLRIHVGKEEQSEARSFSRHGPNAMIARLESPTSNQPSLPCSKRGLEPNQPAKSFSLCAPLPIIMYSYHAAAD
jgi:hypothetical protein